MQRYKRWVVIYFLSVFLVIGTFGAFNYAIDPLWTFCHSHPWNNAQPGFDERQQKINRAYFCGLDRYDTLLLGSSRTTYIDQHDFAPLHVYNLATVAMYPQRYGQWIDVAERIKGKPFDTIILGVDFFGSNDGAFGRQQLHDTPLPQTYYRNAASFMYRYKMLFSIDTFRKSLLSIDHTIHPGTIDYSRDNVKHTIRISPKRKQSAVTQQYQLYAQWVYGPYYRYNQKLKTIFQKLKENHPKSRFIVFTTPISEDMFRLMVQSGRLEDYERWLRNLVAVFGEVYDFMGINTVTSDPNNYADLHHFYPDIGKLIAHRIIGKNDPNIPADFGIRVTAQNIDEHLRKIRRQAASLRKR